MHMELPWSAKQCARHRETDKIEALWLSEKASLGVCHPTGLWTWWGTDCVRHWLKHFARTFIICVVAVQSLSHVRLFVTPWTAAHQASLTFTISWILFRLMSIESVMPSNHLILCHPLLLLLTIFPSIRVFSNGLALCTAWLKNRSFSISLSNEYSGLIILNCPF